MKIKDRLALLKAGYTKSDIEELITAEAAEAAEAAENAAENDNNTEDDNAELTAALDEITNLKKQIEELQKHNINNSSQQAPKKETSDDVWNSFFGNKLGKDD